MDVAVTVAVGSSVGVSDGIGVGSIGSVESASSWAREGPNPRAESAPAPERPNSPLMTTRRLGRTARARARASKRRLSTDGSFLKRDAPPQESVTLVYSGRLA